MDAAKRIEKFFLSDASVSGVVVPNAVHYKPRPTDVIVVGVAKSGTSWLQQVLHQIRTKGDENFEDIYAITWWIPDKPLKNYLDLNAEQVVNPRIYKSHEKYDHVTHCDGTKLVFVARDPYDRQWSFDKFFIRWMGGDEDVSEEMSLQMFEGKMGGLGNGNDYFEVLKSWYPHRNDANVLWLHFEDLKADLRFCIQKIAEFIGMPLSEKELNRVHDFCTFEYMAKNDKRFDADTAMRALAEAMDTQPWVSKCATVRKDGGRVGDGRRGLGPKLKEAIDKKWKDSIQKEFGFPNYDSLYRETSFLKRHLKK